MELIGDARFVLLGEASHGTHEFYRERAEITRRLIAREGLHRRRGRGRLARRLPRQPLRARRGDDDDADAALGGFRRFPTWMWRNTDVLEFVDWLRAHNDALPAGRAEGRLLRARPLQPARLDRGGARLPRQGRPRGRAPRPLALRVLRALRRGPAGLRLRGALRRGRVVRGRGRRAARRAAPPRRRSTRSATGAWREDEYFFAEQNARLVKNAEEYYRTMFGGRVVVVEPARPHMAETLDALVAHLDRAGQDARRSSSGRTTRTSATRAPPRWASRGELNVGQLVRERYGRDARARRLHHLHRAR